MLKQTNQPVQTASNNNLRFPLYHLELLYQCYSLNYFFPFFFSGDGGSEEKQGEKEGRLEGEEITEKV